MTSETSTPSLSRDARLTTGRPPAPTGRTRPRAVGTAAGGRRARRGLPSRPNGWRSPACWSLPPCSTCGAWARPAGPTRSTPPRPRPARSRGRRSSSAPPTRPTSITVDKTPLALWPMGLSVRLFGLSSWSILVPQALEGVAAVGLLLRHGPSYDVLGGRRAARRRHDGADPGRGTDVPLRQPRRDARAPAGRRGVRHSARRRGLARPADAARRRGGCSPGVARRAGVPGEDAPGVPGAPGADPVYACSPASPGGDKSCTCSARSPAWSSPPAGGWRS